MAPEPIHRIPAGAAPHKPGKPGPQRQLTDAERRARHAARTKRAQDARIAAGGRNVRLVLDRPANEALVRLMTASGKTMAEVIARALLLADKLQTARERHECDATPH